MVIRGEVAAVTQALDAADKQALKRPVSMGVIANPHPEIVRLIQKSASRWRNDLTGTSIQ
jgi:microcompartment protein CcmL/EutN